MIHVLVLQVCEAAQPSAMNGTTSPSIDYTIVPITNRDNSRIIDFLRRFFFRDEPLNVCVGLLDGPEDTCAELEQYCVDSIPDGMPCAHVLPLPTTSARNLCIVKRLCGKTFMGWSMRCVIKWFDIDGQIVC